MNARTLAAICGTILSVAAVAQNNTQPSRDTQTDRTRTTNTDRTHDTRTTNTDRATDTRTTTTAARNAQSVLEQIEGVWKVDVHINPAAWGHMSGDQRHTTMGTNRGTTNVDNTNADRTNRDRQTDRTVVEPPKNDDGSIDDQDAWHDPQVEHGKNPTYGDRDNTSRDNAGRDNTNRSANETTRGMMRQTPEGQSQIRDTSFSGYAQTKPVLSKNVMQETIVIPGMKHMGKAYPGREGATNTGTDRSPNSDSMGNDQAFRGISYISFDENSNTYSIVFMDNCSGRMFHDTGTYDATSRRIVFNGNDVDGMGRTTTTYGTDTGTTGNSGMRESTSAGNTGTSGGGTGRGTGNSGHTGGTDGTDGATGSGPIPGGTGGNSGNNTGAGSTGQTGTGTNNTTGSGTNNGANRGGTSSTDRMTDTGNRDDRAMDRNAGTSGARAHYSGSDHYDMDNVRVVLDIVNANQYRVTMYRVDSSRAAGWTPPSDRGQTTEGTLNTNDRNATDATANPATGDVIYTATYTRAEGRDKAEYERLLTQMVTDTE